MKFEKYNIRRTEAIAAITFTSIISFVYIIFSGIQIRVLFIGGGKLLEGYTYAEYARQGFFQLLFVSMINLIIVFVSSIKFEESKALKILLVIISVCTYIMLASSAYRMILYVQSYGLSFLRLFVLWFLALLSILMTGILIYIFNNEFKLFEFCVIIVTLMYLGFAMIRPDARIAEYNLANSKEKDILYLMQDLSYDAAPFIEKSGARNAAISNYFEQILKEYEQDGATIRKYNYARREAFKAAKRYFN